MPSLSQLFSFGSRAAAVLPSGPAAEMKRDAALPDFALQYAPLTYLYSGEGFWPSDVATHLQNVIPENGFTPVGAVGSADLGNLDTYNTSIYLTANGTPTSDPSSWIVSAYGKPDNTTGLSGAPGTIIAVTKNETVTDVFYFTFFSYNYGGTVLDINFDDHVGDWEHLMVRFQSGVPSAVYYSQHGAGSAYQYGVTQKVGDRPVGYIAKGSHANYAKPGKEEYTIAAGIVTDTTDTGYLWDMTLNYRGYTYDVASNTFTTAGGAGTGASEEAGEDATWLSFLGRWGDEQYPSSHKGQYCIFGECHYTTGPTGPLDKNLGRNAVCQNESNCSIFTSLNSITKQS